MRRLSARSARPSATIFCIAMRAILSANSTATNGNQRQPLATCFLTMSCLKIFGLNSLTRKKLNRALELRGLGSQSKWLLTLVNRVIVETEKEHGNLLLRLNAEEQWI